MGALNTIKNLAENGLYYLTEHAIIEAEEDDITIYDVEDILLMGRMRRTWPKEGKYEIVGKASGRDIGVVCRITQGGKVRVITVYADKPKGGR